MTWPIELTEKQYNQMHDNYTVAIENLREELFSVIIAVDKALTDVEKFKTASKKKSVQAAREIVELCKEKYKVDDQYEPIEVNEN